MIQPEIQYQTNIIFVINNQNPW